MPATGWEAIGFRHDIPDRQGRLWRTEGVLRRVDATQDGLSETDESLHMATEAVSGRLTTWLPVVYVSASSNREWLLSCDEIDKLAYDLGGIAHCLVEPSRSFSVRLRDTSAGRNVYNGTVGISIPGQGFRSRLYPGWQIGNPTELALAVRVTATGLRGQLPSPGLDWSELQERALLLQRDSFKGEAEGLFEDYSKELRDLQEENQRLKKQLADQATSVSAADESAFSGRDLVALVGAEIYEGEISDRLRLAAQMALAAADKIGLDSRSRAILGRVAQRFPRSPALHELRQDLVRGDPRSEAGGSGADGAAVPPRLSRKVGEPPHQAGGAERLRGA